MADRILTSISPLMTHGNEFSGEIKLLKSARQVKTYTYENLTYQTEHNSSK